MSDTPHNETSETDTPEPDTLNAPSGPLPGRRLLLGILALFVALLVGVVVRGTWTTTEIHNPTSPDDGFVTQLVDLGDGHTHVRCAVVVDHPADDLFAVVTDYGRFPEIFTWAGRRMTVDDVTETGPDTVRFTGAAHLLSLTVPIDVEIEHRRTPEFLSARWDETSDLQHVNRGGWRVEPLSETRSLLVYSLEVQEHPYPQFLVNNVIHTQAEVVLAKLLDWLRQHPPAN